MQEEVAQENQQKIEAEKQAVQEAEAELDKQRKTSDEADSKYSSVRDKIDQLLEEIEPLKVKIALKKKRHIWHFISHKLSCSFIS